jgi:hypothetical protein
VFHSSKSWKWIEQFDAFCTDQRLRKTRKTVFQRKTRFRTYPHRIRPPMMPWSWVLRHRPTVWHLLCS